MVSLQPLETKHRIHITTAESTLGRKSCPTSDATDIYALDSICVSRDCDNRVAYLPQNLTERKIILILARSRGVGPVVPQEKMSNPPPTEITAAPAPSPPLCTHKVFS